MKRLIIAGMLVMVGMVGYTKNLTWTGGASENWSDSGNWTDEGGNPAAFSAGDNVLFNKGGTVWLRANVLPGDIIFDLPSGVTLTLAFDYNCKIASATSFRKKGSGTLALYSSSNANKNTGVAVSCGVTIEQGTVKFTKANAVYFFNQNPENWWRVKSGATLNVGERNAAGNVGYLMPEHTMNLYVESGGTLEFPASGVNCANAFRNLTLEGGAILVQNGVGSYDATSATYYGLLHIGDTLCITGNTAVTVSDSSNQRWLGLEWGSSMTTFDVADVTKSDATDLLMDKQFVRGASSNVAGFVKKGAGRMTFGANVNSGWSDFGANGDIYVKEGVLEYANRQDQLCAIWDRTIHVNTNATLRFSLRNIINGANFDANGYGLKIVVDNGSFLMEHQDGGHSYVGSELTLIDGILKNTMRGYNDGSSGLALMTLGKRVTLKGTRAYTFNNEGSSNQQVHLWGADATEFVVDDIVAGDTTDATVNWTLIDRWNASTGVNRKERSNLVKSGAGTLCLTSKNNKFSGDVIVEEGTLKLDYPADQTAFGDNINTTLGDLTDSSRSITVFTNGTLSLAQRNLFTACALSGYGNNLLATPIILKGGTLDIADANGLGDITVENGRITYTRGGGWGVLGLHGTFKVVGQEPCVMPQVAYNPYCYLYPDELAVFDVADVTGDASADLFFGLQLTKPLGDEWVEYFRTNLNVTRYGFTKRGAGTMTIEANHTSPYAFNGDVNVEGGELQVNGNIGWQHTCVNVADGAYIAGTGTVYDVAISAGGGLSASAAQTEPLKVVGDLTIGANPVIRIHNPTSIPEADVKVSLMTVAGTVTGAENLSDAIVYLGDSVWESGKYSVKYVNGELTVKSVRGLVLILR